MALLVYEEPVLYIKTTAITGVLSTLINGGTLYLIASATSKRMGQYRNFLLNYQAVTSTVELLLKLSMIETFQPAPAARFHSPLLTFDVKIWMVIAACLATALTVATGLCLFYRHRQVLPLGHWARWKPTHLAIFFIVSYVFYTGLLSYSLCCATLAKGQSTILFDWIRVHPEFQILQTVPEVWIGDFTPTTAIGPNAGELFMVVAAMLLLEIIAVVMPIVLCVSK
ncbi:unnamed protein product, partial [Mesorhabditis spiculigera]